jgi:hypothetical protein
MKNTNTVLVGLVTLCLSFVAPTRGTTQEPSTVAESSQFTATSRHADVMEFIRKLQQQSSKIRLETLATSTEGRKVPLMVIGDPAPTSPADLKFDDRAVVYFQANIHAGEVEGKEAALMLARDILQGKTPNYLDKLVVLIVPIFNADGNEKMSPNNRSDQKGPEQGVGIRYNGQNLDLNRDGMKLETPEVVGLVQNALIRWDPVFFLDAHTHNGSYHEEPVTWTWGLNPNGDHAILNYMAKTLWPAVEKLMREQYGTLTIPHGDFMDVRNPEKGWVPLGPQPRYLSNYVGLRNRLSVLNENYPYADFETRVRGCYNLLRSFLDFCHSNRDEIVALVKEADRKAIERAANPAESDVFIAEYDWEPIEQRFDILGYEMEVTDTGGPRPRVRPTEQKKTYTNVPYYARFIPKRTVRFPRGYFIAVQDPSVIEKIRRHGITVERLTEPAKLEVEAYSVTEITGSERSNQGHYLTSVKGETSQMVKEFPPGTFYVSTAQPLAGLVAYLLEPESDDGLTVWNTFDRYLASQWSREPREHPVYKLYRSANLAKETVE